ncbi:SHOCT-like domain-containing protein, partial [Escherichia coli]|uniref:SHOCT-like domain-containing protein n=1 Tax=Escherichia coli TaxID=562 RepID=UPI001CCCC9FB
MQNERKRILTMLENGTISMDEALTLLEAMEKKQTSTDNGSTQTTETKFTGEDANQDNANDFSGQSKDKDP